MRRSVRDRTGRSSEIEVPRKTSPPRAAVPHGNRSTIPEARTLAERRKNQETMMRLSLTGLMLIYATALAFSQPQPAPAAKDFIKIPSGVIALEHVRLIDGTGAAAKPDQTILISGDKITAIGASNSVQVPAGTTRLDFTRFSALPGFVGLQ